MQTAPNKQGSLKPRVQFPLDSVHILTLTGTKVQWAEVFLHWDLTNQVFCFMLRIVQAQGQQGGCEIFAIPFRSDSDCFGNVS